MSRCWIPSAPETQTRSCGCFCIPEVLEKRAVHLFCFARIFRHGAPSWGVRPHPPCPGSLPRGHFKQGRLEMLCPELSGPPMSP